MKKLYLLFKIIFCFGIFYSNVTEAQDCALLSATFRTSESRCAATGSIKIATTGGSGSYKYKTIGPVNSNFTTTDSITGLSAGVYSVVITDIISNCTFTKTGIVVPGTYEDPRFTLNSVDVSCDNGSNGSISTYGLQNGRPPFTYSIVAPSPMAIGSSNTTGAFSGLKAGDYSIMLTDSCGGIQTRTVTINNYTWKIDSYQFIKTSCDSAKGFIKVIDSKGNLSIPNGISGFTYGAVIQKGDTTWSANGNFAIGANGISSVEVFAKDHCGNIKKVTVSLVFIPSVNGTVAISNKACNSFSAALTGVTNFFNPDFCLYDSNGVKKACNTTGIFDNIPYGRYCIKAHDACTDTIISRCFSAVPPPISIGNDVTIRNKNCNTFDVDITGQVGLTKPSYVLFLNGTVFKGSNLTGTFTNLPYGSYCIATTDGCRDTTITRCFSVKRPVPVVDSIITPSYVTCQKFGFYVKGDSLTQPTYCLYDSNGVKITCNTTGIFDSIPLGNHCVTIHDACLDTIIKRCFSVGPPTITNDVAISITNKTCSTFTATAKTNNLANAKFCLYNKLGDLVTCNSTGIFANLTYGAYQIKSTITCPDTTMINNFSASAPVPAASGTVTISNAVCSTFSAQVAGQQNLTNPQYCILNANKDTIACNTTGKFNNLAYGSYCIRIVNSCYDTTIQICFTKLPAPTKLTANAVKSCLYGTSKFTITFSGAIVPVNVKIYNPGNSLFRDRNYTTTSATIDSLPELATGLFYTIIATDNCGNKDSIKLAPAIGYLNHTPQVVTKCPGSVWANGSGNINATVSSNMGTLTVRIIKKNGAALTPQLQPDFIFGAQYSFNDLGPGTYILSYKANDACNYYLYDTVTVPPYEYPNLTRSSAYQCDINGFSVGAVASNGVGPFSYEIIGSTPSIPSLIAPAQSNPVFNVNNSTNYSLIRLRALDACGNATLGDASILPLANNGITTSLNCFEHPANLSVDPIFNSTYSWYKKANKSAKDSVYLGAKSNYTISSLTPADTGLYVCHITVNNGCIDRNYYFHVTGDCYKILPIMTIQFTGKFIEEKVGLNWSLSHSENLEAIVVERKNSSNKFVEIGKLALAALPSSGIHEYQFIDKMPLDQNFYRLRLVQKNHSFSYSDMVFLQKENISGITVYPNPVKEILNVNFGKPNYHVYKISLLNLLNQKIKEYHFQNIGGRIFQVQRTPDMSSGIYILRITNVNTNEEFSQKVIFHKK